MSRNRDPDGAVNTRKLFDDGGVFNISHSGAAVLLWDRDTQQSQPLHTADDEIAIEPVFAIQVMNVRRDFPPAPFPNRLLEKPLLLSKVEVKHGSRRWYHFRRVITRTRLSADYADYGFYLGGGNWQRATVGRQEEERTAGRTEKKQNAPGEGTSTGT